MAWVRARAWARRCGWAVLAGACLPAAACGERPSAAQCERLFDKTVERYAAPLGTKALTAEQKATYQQSVAAAHKALGGAFAAHCRDTYSPAAVECQLAARSLEDVAACSGHTPAATP